MKKLFACAAVLLSLASGAMAQVQVRGVVGGGITFGGDTLADEKYTNSNYGSDNAQVHAGGLIAIHGGVELQFTDMVSAQALLGYHFDRANGSNGNVRFERYPLELLGHFRVTDWFRAGGGARYTDGAKIRTSGVGSQYAADEDFKPAFGAVFEGEFFPLRSFGIKVRYVSEKFKSKTAGNADADGSHGGIYLTYYFF